MNRKGLHDELRNFLPKCMEKRGDRYYPTEDGCKRLMEWLGERGIDIEVSITDDGRFRVHRCNESRQGRRHHDYP